QVQQTPQQSWKRAASPRRDPAKVTRVLADLLVFVEVEHQERPLGLVFKPDKIKDYRGEPLADIGLTVGANIREIEWDEVTLLISRVVLQRSGGATPPLVAGA